MTRAERLAENRRLFLGAALVETVVLGTQVAVGEIAYAVVCAIAIAHALRCLVRTFAEELAEARKPWRPAPGLHIVDQAQED